MIGLSVFVYSGTVQIHVTLPYLTLSGFASVLETADEERCMLNTIWQWKHKWLGHVSWLFQSSCF